MRAHAARPGCLLGWAVLVPTVGTGRGRADRWAVPGRPIVPTSVHAMPGRPTVPSHRPRHGPIVVPGRHGPDCYRAVPCLGRAKFPCRGPGHRASGHMANYSPMLRRPLWFSAFSDSFCWRENVLSLLTKCFIDWIKVLIDATLENYSNKNIMKHPNTTRCNKSKLWIETSSSSRKKKQN
jgi:hypothetical protein